MNGRMIDLQKRADVVTITTLRVATGVVLAVHGAMKLLDIPVTVQGFTHLGIPYPQYAVYLAIAGELLGGLGLLVGFLTRLAAFGTLSSMIVAIHYGHGGHGLLLQNGGWEYPLILALLSLFFISHGAGPASLDAFASRKRVASGYRAERVKSYA
ncbi:MAG TPA: DoxX family protein [Polyangiaceae bacterium]|nr:DoxX family protein [Polyangiaceae bacterium]